MSQDSLFHATTILAVKKDGHTAVAGDGGVSILLDREDGGGVK